MIPLRDTTKSGAFPYVNLTLITINILVFLYEVSLGENIHNFILDYGLIPAKVFSSANIDLGDRMLHFISSMFIHGGWLHIIGNALFLFIFGDNVEARMGHFKYLVFYIVCGLAAALFQIITNIGSVISNFLKQQLRVIPFLLFHCNESLNMRWDEIVSEKIFHAIR